MNTTIPSAKEQNNNTIKRLGRRLRLDRKHSLHFVVVQPFSCIWTAADHLERVLKPEVNLRSIYLDASEEMPINAILEAAPQACFATPEHPVMAPGDMWVLLIFGLREMLSTNSNRRSSVLYNLNSERDLLRQLRAPTLLWLDHETLDLISSSLPDFWSWTTSVSHLDYSYLLSVDLKPHQSREKKENEAFVRAFHLNKLQLLKLLGRNFPQLSREDLEDILQETFLAVWSRLKSLPDIKDFELYLKTVARHRALYRIREKKRMFDTLPLEQADDVPDGARPLDLVLADQELINFALQELPERDRIVLLAYASGSSLSEISASTGISPSTIRSLLARARRRVNLITLSMLE